MNDPINVAEVLAERMHDPKNIRPKLGDWVNIRVLQNRIVLATLSPGVKDLLYLAGQKLGEALAQNASAKDAKDLRACTAFYARMTEENKIARTELVEVSSTHAVLRSHECAFSFGLPNLKTFVCSFDAGTQAGLISKALGKRVVSREVKCGANGDPYCEFEINVIETPEKAFAEAFKL